MSVLSEWNPKQKILNSIIRKKEYFEQAKELYLELHRFAHFCDGKTKEVTIMEQLWQDLEEYELAIMPTKKDVTIAWDIWHITRIEDLTVNLLIADQEQVLTAQWLQKLKVEVTDSGNAMTDEEIISLSQSIDMEQLKEYRMAVGRRTKEILAGLQFADLSRTFHQRQVDRILQEGGVTEHQDSIWLLDYWGKKNVSGIILMPVTRHQSVHLNEKNIFPICIYEKNSLINFLIFCNYFSILKQIISQYKKMGCALLQNKN